MKISSSTKRSSFNKMELISPEINAKEFRNMNREKKIKLNIIKIKNIFQLFEVYNQKNKFKNYSRSI